MKKGQINVGYKAKRVAYDNTTRLVGSADRYSTIPYSAIVAYASKAAAVPESSIEMAMEALYDAVNYFVLNGHSVQIPNLGTFSLGVHAKSAASEVEFSANFAKNLKRIILRFLPDTELKAMLSSTATSTHVDSTGFKGNGVVAVTSAYSAVNALLYPLNAGRAYGAQFTNIRLAGTRLSKTYLGVAPVTAVFEKEDGSTQQVQLSEDYASLDYGQINIKLKKIFNDRGFKGIRSFVVRDINNAIILQREFAAIPAGIGIAAIAVNSRPTAEGETVAYKAGQVVEVRVAGYSLLDVTTIKVGGIEVEATSASATELRFEVSPNSGNAPIVLSDEQGNEVSYNLSFGDTAGIVISSITSNGMPLVNGGTTNVIAGQSYNIQIAGNGLDALVAEDFILPAGSSLNITSRSATLIAATIVNAQSGDLKVVHDDAQLFAAALVASASQVSVTGWKGSAAGAAQSLSTAITASTDNGAFSGILVGQNIEDLAVGNFNTPATVTGFSYDPATGAFSGTFTSTGTVTINIVDNNTTVGSLKVVRAQSGGGAADGDGD